MKRFIGKYLAYVGAVTICALAYWNTAESVTPGQQYADPWLPRLQIGAMFGPLVMVIVGWIGVVREYRAERRERKARQE